MKQLGSRSGDCWSTARTTEVHPGTAFFQSKSRLTHSAGGWDGLRVELSTIEICRVARIKVG